MMYEFKFPDVGEGIHEGKILKFKSSPHNNIKQGDILAVIETDKVVAEIPSSKTGELIKFGFKEGDTIEVGQTLAYINVKDEKDEVSVEENSDQEAGVVGQLEKASNYIMPASPEIVKKEARPPSLEDAGNVAPTTGPIGQREKGIDSSNQIKEHPARVTPLARRVAKKLGIDPATIKGSGPAGQVLRSDLEEKIETKILKTPLESPLGVIKEELSVTRKAIAKAMETSAAIPTASLFEEVEIAKLVETRERINNNFSMNSQEKIGLQPIIMKILAIALKEFPSFNGTFDKTSSEFSKYHDINIGFATDLPRGLMVPIIKAVQTKNIITINQEMKGLVKKAMDSTITLDDLKQGTISITNYGPFGGLYGTPLIAPPQVAILGIGRIEKKPIVKNNSLEIGTILPLSFTFDHRANDGAIAGNFISRFKELLENPEELFFYLS